MDIQKFESIARDPKRTIDELKIMKSNALAKGKIEFVRLIDELLEKQHPVSGEKKGGGKTPTTASFFEKKQDFESGKEAYLWLVNQFCRHCSHVLQQYETFHFRAGNRSRGRRFARDPKALFPVDSSRQGNASHYAMVDGGWYADINLNHDDKFAALLQLSYLCGLEYGRDWDFNVLGATQQLIKHQQTVVRARKLLDELIIN